MPAPTASAQTGADAQRLHAGVRGRLLECGMLVVAETGTDGDLLARVADRARVTPAQCHEHFRTGDELLHGVADALSNELIMLIEDSAGDFVDAAKRIACGVRIYLQTASDCPVFAKFVARAGLRVAGQPSLIHQYLPAHIFSGTQTARFVEPTTHVAMDLITGTTLAAVVRIAAGPVQPGFMEQVAAAVLRGLGVPGKQAQRLSIIDISSIEPRAGTMLARARAMK